jgi:hypothetical protein
VKIDLNELVVTTILCVLGVIEHLLKIVQVWLNPVLIVSLELPHVLEEGGVRNCHPGEESEQLEDEAGASISDLFYRNYNAR